jgi:hypothetical protein
VDPRPTRTVYDEMLVGGIDLHCHVDLEFSRTMFRKALPEWEWLDRAERAGMRAVLLKSHLWPSVTAAAHLEQLWSGSVHVATSVTLNPMAGGVDPWAVEAAAAMGAKAVFMPTWGARSDREHGGFHKRLAESFQHFDPARLSTLSIVDDSGALIEPAHEVLRLALERNLMVSTGHISWQESLALAREANRLGFERLVLAHPLSGSVDAPHDAVREITRLGAYAEFCWPTVSPGRRNPAEVVALVREIGAQRTVLTSDYFGGSGPSPSDLLRMLAGALYDAGLTLEEIRTAVSTNPAALLSLDAAVG